MGELLNDSGLNGAFDEYHSETFRNLISSREIPHVAMMDYLYNLSEKGMASSKTIIGFLENLIDKKTNTEINLSDYAELFPFEPDFELKVMQLIAFHKPTQITAFHIDGEDYFKGNPPKLERPLWTEITKLEKLRLITIQKYKVSVQDLMAMCRKLTNLSHIRVKIDSESPLPTDDQEFAQEFSKSLRHIRNIFYFLPGKNGNREVERFFKTLTTFSIKRLPNAYRIDTLELLCDMSQACGDMEETSQLRQLVLNAIHLQTVASNCQKFPSITSLEMNWDEWNRTQVNDPLKRMELAHPLEFPALTCLTFHELVSADNLELVLRSIGQKLSLLYFHFQTKHAMNVDLNLIQKLCPKLKCIGIKMGGVEASQSLYTFSSLRELDITFKPGMSKELHLTNILAAQNLTTVRLRGLQITVQELKDLISSIQNTNLLENVEFIALELDGGNMNREMRDLMKSEGECFKAAVRKNKASFIVVNFRVNSSFSPTE
ncbi:Hypothetical predicted protein [Cloeon dipterum]|uniref:Uncharacterized protein n=1 Tax=Cloeon dipterum TaxID=197152 RepID=A0A8S1CW76_9INSE|nr:Hypothetical predicted protein [Cloeon dipterum]